MMNRLLSNAGLSTRLVLGLVLLIILTTLSAGVPAYMVARSQLRAQARQQVEVAQSATESLYIAEQEKSSDLTALLAERPTLKQLLADDAVEALEPYLLAFLEQSEFSFIQVCREGSLVYSAGDSTVPCQSPNGFGFEIVAGQPVLLARQPVFGSESGQLLGVLTTGRRLDETYLQQLSAATGTAHSLLDSQGKRLVSTLSLETGDTPNAMDSINRVYHDIIITGEPYLTAEMSLMNRSGDPELLVEIALPVQQLAQTERNALLILIASTGLVALAGVLLGSWYIRRLTVPLQDLTAAAERIGRGDLVTSIPQPVSPPEMATLATSLEKSQATMLRALDERSQARDWLDSLIQSLVEGVVTFDTHGRVTFISQGAEALLGLSGQHGVGQPVNTIFPLADANGDTFLDRIPPAGEKRDIEILTGLGRTIVLATTGARMVPPNSETIQVALVLRDVTEEQALRNLRSFFLANISHEFRTPLSTLNASMELLMDQADDLTPAEIRELMKPTHLSLVSLQSLINNLLESSSIEAGSFVLRKQVVDLNDVIAETLSITRPLVDRRRQNISVTVSSTLLPLRADKARLTQAVVNLIVNASKYSPEGEPIDLRLQQSDSILRIAVADHGPGISAEDRENLFRRFMRLHAESNEQYGIGLGLYLVKKISEAHGGQVGVEERPGGGSVFWMEIPVVMQEEGV